MSIPHLSTPRRAAIGVCAAILATIALALGIPPCIADNASAAGGGNGLSGELPAWTPEDLSGFAGSERWGVSLADVLEEAAGQDQARRGLNPELRRMGFLGFIETPDGTVVLLADRDQDGGIVQVAPGDTVPDGRVLTAVTDNSITLATNAADGASEGREVLLLFPRGGTDPAASDNI